MVARPNRLGTLVILSALTAIGGASRPAFGEDGAVRESLDQLVAGISRGSGTGSGGLRIVQRGAYAVEWNAVLPIRLRRTQAFITRSRDPQYGTGKVIRQTFNTVPGGDTVDLYIASDSTGEEEVGVQITHSSNDSRIIVAAGSSGGPGQPGTNENILGEPNVDGTAGAAGGGMEFRIGEFAALVAFPGNGGVGGGGENRPESPWKLGVGGNGGDGGPGSVVEVTFRTGGIPAAVRAPDIHVASIDDNSSLWSRFLRIGDGEFGGNRLPPRGFRHLNRFGVGGPGGSAGRGRTVIAGRASAGGTGGNGGPGSDVQVTARIDFNALPRIPLTSGELIAGNGGEGAGGGAPSLGWALFGAPGRGGDGGDVILVRVDQGRATVTAGAGGPGGPGSNAGPRSRNVPQPGPTGSAGQVLLQ